jgi:hypothetical protein
MQERLSATVVAWWLTLRRLQARHALVFDGLVAAAVAVPILSGISDEVSPDGQGLDGLGYG